MPDLFSQIFLFLNTVTEPFSSQVLKRVHIGNNQKVQDAMAIQELFYFFDTYWNIIELLSWRDSLKREEHLNP